MRQPVSPDSALDPKTLVSTGVCLCVPRGTAWISKLTRGRGLLMTDHETSDTRRVSRTPRRAVLLGAAAAVAGVAAEAIVRPLPAEAANGDVVTVGGAFEGTGSTSLRTSGTGQTAAL